MRDTALIRTARLVLRPLRPDDAAAIVAGVGTYDVVKWLAVVPFPYGPEDAAAFLASDAAEPRRAWGICDAAGLRGVISIGGELGYWLARDAWGAGYATEAGDAAVDAAFADPTRRDLVSSHMTVNDRSGRVLERIGFRPTGLGRRSFVALNQVADTRCMVMTRADWRARRRYRVRAGPLRLTELRPRDLEAIRLLASAASGPAWSTQAAQQWMAARVYRGRPGFAAAIRRRGRVIGLLELTAGQGDVPQVDIAPAPSCGTGEAETALTAFLADARDRFGLDTVAVRAGPGHTGAASLMEQAGFHAQTAPSQLEPFGRVLYRHHRP